LARGGRRPLQPLDKNVHWLGVFVDGQLQHKNKITKKGF
jgi:hypothetical protein